MPLILAIDQSTSATKAILFDDRGKVLDRAARDHRQIYPRPGRVEHDAEEIWSNVVAVAREIAGRQAGRLREIVGVCLANQRETILVFDRVTGKPLHPALVWQDRRGDAICAELIRIGAGDTVRDKTGLKIDTYFSASKLKWLAANEPALAERMRRGDAVAGTIDAYLVHRLTSGKVCATDVTNASRTLLFDIRKLAWDAELCGLFDVPLRALPDVRESASSFGETDIEGILPRAVPIAGVMGDSQAALFAQRCFEPGTAKATFGTGTSLLLNAGQEVPRATSAAVVALAWVLHGRPTYALEGLINFSAATIEWLKNQLGLIRSADEVEAMAAGIPDNGGVYLVPAFAGLSAPYWAPDARAAIVGMTAHTRKEHVVRAALESVAYQIRDVLDAMRSESGISPACLHADGGPTRNRFLMQFTADITGTELKVAEISQASAWGAAMSGMLALGLRKSLEDLASEPRQSTIYRPTDNRIDVDRWHREWSAALKRVL